MKPEFKSKTVNQLKKAEGMLKKVIKMTEEDVYCIDLLQQSLAVTGLMKGANKLILENHLHSCFKAGMQKSSDKKQKELIAELIQIVSKA